jgi:hypothetical protein
MSDLSNQELIRKIVESLKRTGRRFGSKKAANRRAKNATQPRRKSAAARARSAIKRRPP